MAPTETQLAFLPAMEATPSSSIAGAWVVHCHQCKPTITQVFSTLTEEENHERASRFMLNHLTNFHHSYADALI